MAIKLHLEKNQKTGKWECRGELSYAALRRGEDKIRITGSTPAAAIGSAVAKGYDVSYYDEATLKNVRFKAGSDTSKIPDVNDVVIDLPRGPKQQARFSDFTPDQWSEYYHYHHIVDHFGELNLGELKITTLEKAMEIASKKGLNVQTHIKRSKGLFQIFFVKK